MRSRSFISLRHWLTAGYVPSQIDQALIERNVHHLFAGNYVDIQPSSVRDRRCARCRSGDFSNSTNAPVCEVHSTCQVGTFETTLPTSTSDRTCTNCTAGETYQDKPGQLICLRVRGPCTEMEIEVPPTTSTDRKCVPIDLRCPSGHFRTSPEGTCEACPGGFWTSNPMATSCTRCNECEWPGNYAAHECGGGSPGLCLSCDERCPEGKTMVSQCTPTSQVVCRQCRAECIPDRQLEVVPCTTDTDRQCVDLWTDDQCERCSSRLVADIVFVLDVVDIISFTLAKTFVAAALGFVGQEQQVAVIINTAAVRPPILLAGARTHLEVPAMLEAVTFDPMYPPSVNETAGIQAAEALLAAGLGNGDSEARRILVLVSAGRDFAATRVPPASTIVGSTTRIVVGVGNFNALSDWVNWTKSSDLVFLVPTAEDLPSVGHSVERAAFCSLACAAGTFESLPCSFSRPRQCTDLTNCTEAGSFESAPPTTTTDRQCEICGSGEMLSRGGCAPCPIGTFQVAITHKNPMCFAHREKCGPGFFEAVPPTATGNRICKPCTQCDNGMFSRSQCTEKDDTVCEVCATVCAPGMYMDGISCLDDIGPVCRLCSVCDANSIEISACTTSRNTICKPTNIDDDNAEDKTSRSTELVIWVVMAGCVLLLVVTVYYCRQTVIEYRDLKFNERGVLWAGPDCDFELTINEAIATANAAEKANFRPRSELIGSHIKYGTISRRQSNWHRFKSSLQRNSFTKSKGVEIQGQVRSNSGWSLVESNLNSPEVCSNPGLMSLDRQKKADISIPKLSLKSPSITQLGHTQSSETDEVTLPGSPLSCRSKTRHEFSRAESTVILDRFGFSQRPMLSTTLASPTPTPHFIRQQSRIVIPETSRFSVDLSTFEQTKDSFDELTPNRLGSRSSSYGTALDETLDETTTISDLPTSPVEGHDRDDKNRPMFDTLGRKRRAIAAQNSWEEGALSNEDPYDGIAKAKVHSSLTAELDGEAVGSSWIKKKTWTKVSLVYLLWLSPYSCVFSYVSYFTFYACWTRASIICVS